MSRLEQIDARHLSYLAGIIAIALVDLCLEKRLGVSGFDADHWQSRFRQPTEQPLRQWAGFKADPDKSLGWIVE